MSQLPPDQIKDYAFAMMGVHTIPMAVTTVCDGRANGWMVLSGGPAGVIPEAPRASVGVTKDNFSHDLVRDGKVFVLHVLGASEALIETSLDIVRTFGGRSGRDGDKLGGLRTAVGVTGAPILLDALACVEVEVSGSLDNEEGTIFVGDVVSARRLNAGDRLDIGEAWGKLGAWTEEYGLRMAAEVDFARRLRGLSIPSEA